MPVLMTYGDSNTHGTLPLKERGKFERYGPETRWPTRAAAKLGPDWHLIEEGLPGRTAAQNDPVMGDHMNGQVGLKIAMMTHAGFDVMTIMLGTNDVKGRFGNTPDRVAAAIAGLLDIARSPEMLNRCGSFKTLLICPPPVEESGILRVDYTGGRAKALALPALYRDLADTYGVGFLDAGQFARVDPADGVHWDADSHIRMADAVADAVAAL